MVWGWTDREIGPRLQLTSLQNVRLSSVSNHQNSSFLELKYRALQETLPDTGDSNIWDHSTSLGQFFPQGSSRLVWKTSPGALRTQLAWLLLQQAATGFKTPNGKSKG